VHVVVPDAIDDPNRPSGGNRYDRNVCTGLAGAGWQVIEHAVADAWPRVGVGGLRETARVLADLPDGALVLVDGLIASTAASVVVPAAARLSMVALVHSPAGDGPGARAAEGAVLRAARTVIATSGWTRDRLLDRYSLVPERVFVAEPGVDPASPAFTTPNGTRLLCVAAVAPHKGHDLLLAALGALADRPWRCSCVGPLDRDWRYVARLRRTLETANLADRLRLTGPLTGPPLDRAYRTADVLVHASRGETYGMVVTEALARGVPVIAPAVGGLPDALGHAPDGTRPGMLVPPDDAVALTGALRSWLTSASLRRRLRRAALARRSTLPRWSSTTNHVARALTAAAA
jgi:glycosyltransferase involved in cell wall biosynthesis